MFLRKHMKNKFLVIVDVIGICCFCLYFLFFKNVGEPEDILYEENIEITVERFKSVKELESYSLKKKKGKLPKDLRV